ncbi:MAG: hypothetical protein ACSHW0_04590 [Thalassotalea sp.]
MDINQRNKSRKSLVMVILAFALPIILAKLALTFQWLEYGVTNQGELLEPPLPITNLGLAAHPEDKQWLLVYLLPENCEQLCQQVLVGVNNTYIALGKEMPRVTPVALYQSSLSSEQLATVRQHEWQFTQASNKALTNADQTKLYVVDPMGNILMSHHLPTSNDNIPSFGKAVLADMKKLLKYSKVG